MITTAPNFEAERAYWNRRYREGYDSGAGSYGEAMLRKVEWLRELQGVRTITEIGCGDFSFGSHLLSKIPHARYRGFDISDVIVQRNRQLYAGDRVSFYGLSGELIPPADLVLCVDVLFHIADDDAYAAMLQVLRQSWRKYLAVSAYEYDGIRQGHVHIRKFDPSIFGKPLLREVTEADGEMRFYIFEK